MKKKNKEVLICYRSYCGLSEGIGHRLVECEELSIDFLNKQIRSLKIEQEAENIVITNVVVLK